MAMRYEDASWHRPYGLNDGDGEGLGFGTGGGRVTGELAGEMRWANFPRRRQDGVWTPNLRGVIRTSGADEVLVAMHGQSVQMTGGNSRAILARVELTTDVPDLRWLNTCFLVGEGAIDEDREEWWLDVYVCVNELAPRPPAIGGEPPERFRQGAA
jgi:hypothetical protein